MDKILIIVPHLSTGGMPQFVLKQIETLNKNHDIYLVEWEDITGGLFVVHRNKIKELLNDNFYSLNNDKLELFNIIKQINPSVIHFHEIPETFIGISELDRIFSNKRDYKIVITTHSSLVDPNNLLFIADRFILVSEWSKDIFNDYFKDKVSCEIFEYPIEKIKYDKKLAKKRMGWDDNKTHILNVGLFTSGKNQGELFELSRIMSDDFIFHFVGNQAINFKEYWEPLLENIPKNCIIHGEQNDVNKFYEAADIFYFTSNYELNPIVVKESISHGLPTFIKKLHTYKDMYDGLVTYISNNQEENKRELKNTINYV